MKPFLPLSKDKKDNTKSTSKLVILLLIDKISINVFPDLSCVYVLALVLPVLVKRLPGPVGGPLQAVILLVEMAKVVRQLPPHHALLHEAGHAFALGLGLLFDVDNGPLHRNLKNENVKVKIICSYFTK